jgi:hypothetical protein
MLRMLMLLLLRQSMRNGYGRPSTIYYTPLHPPPPRKAVAAIIVLMPVRPNAKLLTEVVVVVVVVVVVGRPVVCVVNLTAKLDMIQYTY